MLLSRSLNSLRQNVRLFFPCFDFAIQLLLFLPQTYYYIGFIAHFSVKVLINLALGLIKLIVLIIHCCRVDCYALFIFGVYLTKKCNIVFCPNYKIFHIRHLSLILQTLLSYIRSVTVRLFIHMVWHYLSMNWWWWWAILPLKWRNVSVQNFTYH